MRERLGGPLIEDRNVRAFIIESLSPRIPLEDVHTIRNASLEQARDLEKEGKWRDAAIFLVAISKESKDIHVRIETLIEASQMLINLGVLGQARELIYKAEEELTNLPIESGEIANRRYYNAAIYGKLGWLADYEGDFDQAYTYFSKVRGLLREREDQRETDLYSNATHFIGRALVGRALGGKNSRMRHAYLNEAIGYFNEDLQRYLELRKQGKPQPGGEAFQHCWIARCYIYNRQSVSASNEVAKAEALFLEDKENGSSSLGHIYNLRGAIHILDGKPLAAKEYFEAGLATWTARESESRFPKGEAESMMGLALSYRAMGKSGAALSYALRAVKTYPALLFRRI